MIVAEPAELLTVSIRRYKNLRDVEVPWASGLALYGPNGSGKTNLLECLALLMGTGRSLALATDRLARPASGDLSVVARMPHTRLPLPPAYCFNASGSGASAGWRYRFARDEDWWTALGADQGATLSQGLSSADLPARLRELLMSEASRPLMRYSLSSFVVEDARSFRRLFDRQWLVQDVPTWLEELAPDLPDLFGPLRTWLSAEEKSSFVPLMELPPTDEPPAELEWLSRARTSGEVIDDLLTSFRAALPKTTRFVQRLSSLPLTDLGDSVTGDAHWWLHEVATAAANEELHGAAAHLSLESLGDDDAMWAVCRTGEAQHLATTHVDGPLLELLSSGERRWVDEALATGARALQRHGQRCQWQATLWDEVAQHPDTVEVLPTLASEIEPELEYNEYFTSDVLNRLSELFEQQLWRAGQEMVGRDPAVAAVVQHLLPGLRAIADPVQTIRVFDEPEAHLHPSAQRQIRAALMRWSREGADVVIATHSHYFLGLPDFTQVHVMRGTEGPVVHRLNERDLVAQSSLARSMGLTRGELLVNYRLVLVVEGEHDRIVLQGLFEEELTAAGVLLLVLHGTYNALALVDAEFWVRATDLPLAVLFDNVRLDGQKTMRRDQRSREENALADLQARLKKAGRELHRFGLTRPDITAYFPEELLRKDHPDFPQWSHLIRNWKRTRRPFKEFVSSQTEVDLSTRRVRQLVERMQQEKMPPHGEMRRKVSEIVALAQGDVLAEQGTS